MFRRKLPPSSEVSPDDRCDALNQLVTLLRKAEVSAETCQGFETGFLTESTDKTSPFFFIVESTMSCTTDNNSKPKSMDRAKERTTKVENLFRVQQTGYRDKLDYKQVKYGASVEKWPELCEEAPTSRQQLLLLQQEKGM